MVLVETTTEERLPIPDKELRVMMEGVDDGAVLGYEAEHKFTTEEWQEMKNQGEGHANRAATADAESKLAESSYAKLGEAAVRYTGPRKQAFGCDQGEEWTRISQALRCWSCKEKRN